MHQPLYADPGCAGESTRSSCLAHRCARSLAWAKSYERCAWRDCAAQCVFEQPRLFDAERAKTLAVLLALLQSLHLLLYTLRTRVPVSSSSRDGELVQPAVPDESASSLPRAPKITPHSIVRAMWSRSFQRQAPSLSVKFTNTLALEPPTSILESVFGAEAGVKSDLDGVLGGVDVNVCSHSDGDIGGGVVDCLKTGSVVVHKDVSDVVLCVKGGLAYFDDAAGRSDDADIQDGDTHRARSDAGLGLTLNTTMLAEKSSLAILTAALCWLPLALALAASASSYLLVLASKSSEHSVRALLCDAALLVGAELVVMLVRLIAAPEHILSAECQAWPWRDLIRRRNSSL